ncbi:MAG: hypothetical protein PHO57_10110 [Acidithiobacillus sp.]|nr:hypothetical protein [Acidithiobacillus sp.]
MSTLNDVLKGIRETILLNERITRLSEEVEQMAERERDLSLRMVRVETFLEFLRPALRRLPPNDT